MNFAAVSVYRSRFVTEVTLVFRRAGELPLCNFAGRNYWTLNFLISLEFCQSWRSLLLSCRSVRSLKTWENLFCSFCEYSGWTVLNACVLYFCSAKKSAPIGWSRVIGNFAHMDPHNCCMRSWSATTAASGCTASLQWAGWAPKNPSGCIPFAWSSICVVEVVNVFIFDLSSCI